MTIADDTSIASGRTRFAPEKTATAPENRDHRLEHFVRAPGSLCIQKARVRVMAKHPSVRPIKENVLRATLNDVSFFSGAIAQW